VLWRALNSVIQQEGVDLELIVVVNGSKVYEPLYSKICSIEKIRVSRLEQGLLPAAQRHGRSLVTREFFTLLDDDDELLPNALRLRSDLMSQQPHADVIASNGYITYDGQKDHLHFDNFHEVQADPFTALMKSNWLSSCGSLFRTRTIPVDFFDGRTKYFEWTLLALTVLEHGRVVQFLDAPTFRKHEEIEGSLSKSDAYRDATIPFLTGLTEHDLPPRVMVELEKKIGRAFHFKSVRCRRKGHFRDAWKYHIHSLRWGGGARYLLYSIKLLVPLRRSQRA
jgi:glycosyltransferase involved in cell wall biosynthesis